MDHVRGYLLRRHQFMLIHGSFIHGGAWRDPLDNSMSFKPTLDRLAKFEDQTNIAGYASINYRLSPYPNHPTCPSSPDDASRNAKHPDHINDVTRALLYLQRKYGIDKHYVLVGHSAGATLAYQVPQVYNDEKVPVPACIIGSEGIYDIPSLLDVHTHVPFYRQFCVAAFGDDSKAWKEESPTTCTKAAIWAKTRTCIISHSEEDDLVEKTQATKMMARLKSSKDWRGECKYVAVTGSHMEVFQCGKELARVIKIGLESWRIGAQGKRISGPMRGLSNEQIQCIDYCDQ